MAVYPSRHIGWIGLFIIALYIFPGCLWGNYICAEEKPTERIIGMFGVLFWISFLFVFYVYFGYPFLIWILSRTKPEESISSIISEDELPTVTLMICTYKEEAVIERKLKNSLALKYPKEKFDILVVNDGCLDRTAELVRQFSNQGVRLSQSDERGGKTSAISRGNRR